MKPQFTTTVLNSTCHPLRPDPPPDRGVCRTEAKVTYANAAAPSYAPSPLLLFVVSRACRDHRQCGLVLWTMAILLLGRLSIRRLRGGPTLVGEWRRRQRKEQEWLDRTHEGC